MPRPSSRDRFVAFRRSIGRIPRLRRRTVEARGLTFAVWTTDQMDGATPLVVINGGLLYGHEIVWPALSPLARRRQLVLYDQRGRGASPAPPAPRAATIEHDAGDVGAIRQALGVREWDVLGHSWGGAVALLGAERDQDGTRCVVTVDAVGPTSAWMPALHEEAMRRLDAGGRAALARLDTQSLADPDPERQSAYSRTIYPAWFADAEFARFFAPPRAISSTGAAIAARLRREGYDWRPLLRALRRPTLVIHGERDALPYTAAEELAATLPDARLHAIPGAGHMPFWEAPEPFFAAVDAFLSEPDSSPP